MTDLELAWARFAMAWNHLSSEITIIWTRFSAFLLIEAALIAFVGQSDERWLVVGLSVFGVLLTLIWWAVTHSSLKWLQHWRRVAWEREQDLPGIENPAPLRAGHRGHDFTHLWSDARKLTTTDKWEGWLRPTRIAEWTPVLITLLWIVVGAYFLLYPDAALKHGDAR